MGDGAGGHHGSALSSAELPRSWPGKRYILYQCCFHPQQSVITSLQAQTLHQPYPNGWRTQLHGDNLWGQRGGVLCQRAMQLQGQGRQFRTVNFLRLNHDVFASQFWVQKGKHYRLQVNFPKLLPQASPGKCRQVKEAGYCEAPKYSAEYSAAMRMCSKACGRCGNLICEVLPRHCGLICTRLERILRY